MADLSDVETALVELAAAAVYPRGVGQTSVTGCVVRLHRGFPQPGSLDADLGHGIAHVSVYPLDGGSRNTTRYPPDWHDLPATVPTITATVAGNIITFAGTVSSGVNIGILCGGTGYIEAVEPENSLTDVVTGIAAQIDGATNVGPVLTLPAPGTVTITAVSGSMSEVRRQEQRLALTVWCPTPAARDALGAAVDLAVASSPWLALPDGTSARLRWFDQRVSDAGSNAHLYRRDITVLVEYATTVTIQAAPMIFGSGILTDAEGAIHAF